jgi:hypothetical protein
MVQGSAELISNHRCNSLISLPRSSRSHYLPSMPHSTPPQVMLRGVALGTKHAARAIKAGGRGGVIINTSSVAGITANCSSHGDPVYVAAGKRQGGRGQGGGGVGGFTRSKRMVTTLDSN